MICIFCDNENDAKGVEHIVSESLGNKSYVMEKGKVCDKCNSRFSKFEDKALTKSVLAMERARFAVKTKKKRNVKGKVKEIDIEGDSNFRETYLTVKGLNPENFKDYDPKTGIGQLVVPMFDKSEVAMSKLLLKIALESIYTSRRKIFKKYDFTELKDFLTTKNNNDWPFLNTDYESEKFVSIPRFQDKHILQKSHNEIKFVEIDENTLLFKYKYGGIAMTINLLNRNLEWTEPFLDREEHSIMYSEKFRKKVKITKT